MGRHGIASLTASADAFGVTRLTRVTHRSPARLLPYKAALASAAGATNVAIGSYGGGLLGGDVVQLDLMAEPKAKLVVGTQASTKVYRARGGRGPARQELNATVEKDALLVWAPDPLVPFAQSGYAGDQRFALEPGASLVAIDWLGAGRTACGERWAFDSYSSRTEIRFIGAEESAPSLVEAMSLHAGCHAQRAAGFDVGGTPRDAAGVRPA